MLDFEEAPEHLFQFGIGVECLDRIIWKTADEFCPLTIHLFVEFLGGRGDNGCLEFTGGDGDKYAMGRE